MEAGINSYYTSLVDFIYWSDEGMIGAKIIEDCLFVENSFTIVIIMTH
jgi:hypothetical protein